MRKSTFSVKSLLVVSAFLCGWVLVSCGGGGSGTSGSSTLKKNDYLGNLPALYDGHTVEVDALEKKIEEESEKLMAGGEKNYSKIQKLFDDQKVKEKEMKEKFQAAVKEEIARLVGKDVPFSFSEKLENSGMLFYQVSDVKMVDEKGELKVTFTITAKDDFTIPSMKAYDYMIYYRLAGSDGVLQKSTSCIIPVSLAREAKPFKKGEMLIQSSIGFNLKNYAADRATFSGVEFISKEEYDAANGK